MSDPRCADLIDADIKNTEDYLSGLLDRLEGDTSDDERDEIATQLDEFAAGTEKYNVLRLVLSGGGPSSFIDVIYTPYGDIQNIAYHYQDWYDGAVKLLPKSSPIWQYAEGQLDGNIILST